MALLGKKKKKKNKDEEAEEGAEGAEDAEAESEDSDGAEGAQGEEGGKEGGGKKSKKKIIVLGVLALILVGGGAGGAYYAGLFGGGDKEAKARDAEGATQSVYYTMPEFLVNLNSAGKSSSFLKTTIILELKGQTDVLVVEANLPRLMDAFNTYLRELRSSDLAGSAGIQRLREELLLRTNKALAPTEINDVLFKEIVVQ
ncbi:MAG: flagellar basal body-associated FliL family protein [Alphaproteobacteria bacterium]